MYNNNFNNWNNPMFQRQSLAPHYDIIKVNGEAGAKNVAMGPNSEALLLDETAPIIWFAQTDGTGYLQVTPFDITPHKPQGQIDLADLSARVSKLEEKLNNVQQSDSGIQKQPKRAKSAPTAADLAD